MSMSKGQRTKDHILKIGFSYASAIGLNELSIGKLAQECELSRSGLFSHFNSKEQLQIEILQYAEKEFYETVFKPCEEIDNPLERLQKICELWPGWERKCSIEVRGGCLFMSSIFEFDDREGEVKNYVLWGQKKLIKYFRLLFEEGQKKSVFKKEDTPEQLAYEFFSKYTGYHIYARFLKHKDAMKMLSQSVLTFIERISVK